MNKLVLIFALLITIAQVVSATDTPRSVDIRRLLDCPECFRNQRIATTGYYAYDGHSKFLSESQKTAKRQTTRLRIFLDLNDTILTQHELRTVPYGSFVRVVGIFNYRDMGGKPKRPPLKGGAAEIEYVSSGFGSMGIFAQQITSITDFQILKEGKNVGK